MPLVYTTIEHNGFFLLPPPNLVTLPAELLVMMLLPTESKLAVPVINWGHHTVQFARSSVILNL